MTTLRLKTLLVLLAFGAGIWAGFHWWRADELEHGTNFLVYDREGATCPVVIPRRATPAEREAARLVSETLADAEGVHPLRFPIVSEQEWREGQRGIFIGRTLHAMRLAPLSGDSALERPVAWDVIPDGVIIRTRWPQDVIAATSWFLERAVGARWFVPGELGREVEHRAELRLPFGPHIAWPSYYSREFTGFEHPEEKAWGRINRLQPVLELSRNLSALLPPEQLLRTPAVAPVLNGRRYLSRAVTDTLWQPDYTQAEAVTPVVNAARAAFQARGDRLSFSIGPNENYHFDQTPPTLDAVAPARYFRGHPDYSALFFGYLNRVAVDVARDYPDRLLTTYAQGWMENAPAFRVEPNVVPFLVADRSGWASPDFAAADRALIARWHDAGPRLLGLYDYYQGAPYFVPRPMLGAISQSLPYAYEHGARAFIAESTANWGLDGPKLWLASQLLWDARQDPAALLREYYRRFWQDAWAPMRRFHEIAEQAWQGRSANVARSAFNRDEQQRCLYPPEIRAQLRAQLDLAWNLTLSPRVRQRLLVVRAAFAVMDDFCRHDELRETLERQAMDPAVNPHALAWTWNQYTAAREALRLSQAAVRQRYPLALQSDLLGDYLRNDPRRRAVWALSRRPGHLGLLQEAGLRSLFSGRRTTEAELSGLAEEQLPDYPLASVHLRAAPAFTLVDWLASGTPWRARGEPAEGRAITLQPAPAGGQSLRYAGCRQESIFQWIALQPGGMYLATVRVRARVSAGNDTYLIVSYLDQEGRLIGTGSADRLPVGDWSRGTELLVLVRPPRSAVQIGISLRVQDQAAGDFAEWEQPSLRRLP